jgi:hypothetical protein
MTLFEQRLAIKPMPEPHVSAPLRGGSPAQFSAAPEPTVRWGESGLGPSRPISGARNVRLRRKRKFECPYKHIRWQVKATRLPWSAAGAPDADGLEVRRERLSSPSCAPRLALDHPAFAPPRNAPQRHAQRRHGRAAAPAIAAVHPSPRRHVRRVGSRLNATCDPPIGESK